MGKSFNMFLVYRIKFHLLSLKFTGGWNGTKHVKGIQPYYKAWGILFIHKETMHSLAGSIEFPSLPVLGRAQLRWHHFLSFHRHTAFSWNISLFFCFSLRWILHRDNTTWSNYLMYRRKEKLALLPKFLEPRHILFLSVVLYYLRTMNFENMT